MLQNRPPVRQETKSRRYTSHDAHLHTKKTATKFPNCGHIFKNDTDAKNQMSFWRRWDFWRRWVFDVGGIQGGCILRKNAVSRFR